MNNIEFTKYREQGAYHWKWYRENKYEYRDFALQVLTYFPEKGTLLDIGCGDGLMCHLFHQRGFKVAGIDLDADAIRLGRRKIQMEYLKRNPLSYLKNMFKKGGHREFLAREGISLTRISVYDYQPEGKFDYSLCQEVLEHLPEPERLIRKIQDSTGKYCILTTPNGASRRPNKLDYKFYTREELLDLMGRHRTEILAENEKKLIARLWCNK